MASVRPLTFSPLDQRLIERKLLNEEERGWLETLHGGTLKASTPRRSVC